MERIYVDHYTGRLERTDLCRVRLIMTDGRVIDDLEPRRLFPLTNLDMYISLVDARDKEIALVRDLAEIDADSRKALEECFAEYYMIPRIRKILSIEEKFGILKWETETDRGPVSFRIKNRHSDIKLLYGSSRILIRDSNDNRYEITDYTKLDQKSLSALFPYI